MLLHFAARSCMTGFAIVAFSIPATAGEQTSQQFICHDGTAFSVATMRVTQTKLPWGAPRICRVVMLFSSRWVGRRLYDG